jgi:hypothetical protein
VISVLVNYYFHFLDLDPSMITYDDVIGMVTKLSDECTKTEQRLQNKSKEWFQERNKIRKLVGQLIKDLQIGNLLNTGCPVKIRTTSFKNITFFVIARFSKIKFYNSR